MVQVRTFRPGDEHRFEHGSHRDLSILRLHHRSMGDRSRDQHMHPSTHTARQTLRLAM